MLSLKVKGIPEVKFLQDNEIIELYFARDERAIGETQTKYGDYCFTVANNILSDRLDSEECVNDTWLKTWNSIPPVRPKIFSAFLAKITRNSAINRLNYRMAKKRAKSCVAFDEIGECVPSGANTEESVILRELEERINSFLRTLSKRDRSVFIRRYFFSESTGTIAEKYNLKEDNVLTILSRTRKKLKKVLEEGNL